MGLSNGILSSPIGIGDLQKALGSSSLDTGKLCTASSINKWSKSKPFVYPAWGFTGVDTAAMKDNMRAAAKTKNYGFSSLGEMYTISSWNNMVSSVTKDGVTYDYGFQVAWYYQRPEGTSSSPFRILDFDGYATPQAMYRIWSGTNDDTHLYAPMGFYLQINSNPLAKNNKIFYGMQLRTETDDPLIYLDDLSVPTGLDFANWYHGIALVEYRDGGCSTSYNNYIYISSHKPSDGTSAGVADYSTIAIGSTIADGKSYFIVPILANSAPYVNGSSVADMWCAAQAWPVTSASGTEAVTIVTIDGNYLGSVRTTKSSEASTLVANVDSVSVGTSSTTATVVLENGSDESTASLFTCYAYLCAERTMDWNPDYETKVKNAISSALSSGTVPTADITDDDGNVIGRLIVFYNSTTAKSVTDTDAVYIDKSVAFIQDGEGYSYADGAYLYGGMSFKLGSGNMQYTTWGQA